MGTLAVKSVSKVYGDPEGADALLALDDISFEIPNNCFCAILGHSGCGKTTLLNIAAGFEKPTAGAVTLDGEDVHAPGWQNTMIFQDYALFPWMSVAQNISFGLEMKNVARHKREGIVTHYIELVGLAGFEDKYPHQLSGGMRQRVAIARARCSRISSLWTSRSPRSTRRTVASCRTSSPASGNANRRR